MSVKGTVFEISVRSRER